MNVNTTPQHPDEEALLARCNEIGLDDRETALLHDLLGWNNRNEAQDGIPDSYEGIEPQLTLRWNAQRVLGQSAGIVTEKDLETGKSIAQILRKLIGEELMPQVEKEPATTLQGKLGLSRLSAVWVVAQLHIEAEKCPDIYNEIQELCTWYDPERMPSSVVGPTLSRLLAPR